MHTQLSGSKTEKLILRLLKLTFVLMDTNLHISKESTFFCFTKVKSVEEPKLREI